MKRIFLSLLLVLAAAPALAQGGAPAALDSLARVRVTQSAVHPERLVGTLLGADSQAVVVARGGERYALPAATIQRLEVSRGRRSVGENVWRGASRGFLIGALAGALLGGAAVLTDDSNCGECWITDEVAVGVITFTGALAGTTVGVLAGAASSRERWETVPLPPRR